VANFFPYHNDFDIRARTSGSIIGSVLTLLMIRDTIIISVLHIA